MKTMKIFLQEWLQFFMGPYTKEKERQPLYAPHEILPKVVAVFREAGIKLVIRKRNDADEIIIGFMKQGAEPNISPMLFEASYNDTTDLWFRRFSYNEPLPHFIIRKEYGDISGRTFVGTMNYRGKSNEYLITQSQHSFNAFGVKPSTLPRLKEMIQLMYVSCYDFEKIASPTLCIVTYLKTDQYLFTMMVIDERYPTESLVFSDEYEAVD